MKWIKKLGSWIWAVIVGLGLVAYAIIKAVLSRQNKRSATAVATTATARNEGSAVDTGAAAVAVGHAEGVQDAAAATITNVVETTPPQSDARLDDLAGVLNTMKRENR